MNKQELQSLYLDALQDITQRGMEIDRLSSIKIMIALYLRMFGEIFHLVGTDSDSDYQGKEYEYGSSVDGPKSLEKYVEKHSEECVVIRNFDCRFIIADHLILACDGDSVYGVYKEDFLPSEVIDCIVTCEEEDVKYMQYVTSSGNGFSTMEMEVKKQDCNIESNYNDDFPYNKIVSFIDGDESGLMILYGSPGTGKTSILRHLIYNTDKTFVFLDSSCFNYITDASFVSMLISRRNSVIVLEDCEDLLRDRIAGNNKLSALLNLSDGILGDSLNLKFICTFNAQLRNIDEAVLRKGRLKLKYEFKELTSEKTQALAKKLNKKIPEGKSLPLCEVYSYGEDNGASQNIKRPIGF